MFGKVIKQKLVLLLVLLFPMRRILQLWKQVVALYVDAPPAIIADPVALISSSSSSTGAADEDDADVDALQCDR